MSTKKERSEAARLLASLRKKVKVACARCGKVVSGGVARRYCSAACRQAAWRERELAKGKR
jgi:hypothetical protein